MSKSKKKDKIVLSIAIVTLIIVLAVAITLYFVFKDRQQSVEVELLENLILEDAVHNISLSIPFEHYINTSSGMAYIKDSEDMNKIVNLVKQIYPQYTVTLYGNTLIRIYKENEACFYLKRSAFIVHDKYGMTFDTRNLQHFTSSDLSYDKTVPILTPYEYFYAINSIYTMDFPFVFSVSYDTKLKLMPDCNIDTFYDFYSKYSRYIVSYEDEARTLLYLYDTQVSQPIWIFFGDNYCKYSV